MKIKSTRWKNLSADDRSKAFRLLRMTVHNRKRGKLLEILNITNPILILCISKKTNSDYIKIDKSRSEQFYVVLGKYLRGKPTNQK